MKKLLVFGVLGLGLLLLAGCGGGAYHVGGGYSSGYRSHHGHHYRPVHHHTVIHRYHSRPPVCRY